MNEEELRISANLKSWDMTKDRVSRWSKDDPLQINPQVVVATACNVILDLEARIAELEHNESNPSILTKKEVIHAIGAMLQIKKDFDSEIRVEDKIDTHHLECGKECLAAIDDLENYLIDEVGIVMGNIPVHDTAKWERLFLRANKSIDAIRKSNSKALQDYSL